MIPASLHPRGALAMAALLAGVGATAPAQPGPVGILQLILLPGETGQCFCRRGDGGQGVPAGLRWSVLEGPGSIDPDSGRFTAGWVEDVALVKLGLGPADQAEAPSAVQVLVLPHEPFALVRRILGPDWPEAHSGQLPYLDPETGTRPKVPGRVRPAASPPRTWPNRLVVGYGLPITLSWVPYPAPWARLSYHEGDTPVRLEVDGATTRTLTFRGSVAGCTLETVPIPIAFYCNPPWYAPRTVLRTDSRAGIPPAASSRVPPAPRAGLAPVATGIAFRRPDARCKRRSSVDFLAQWVQTCSPRFLAGLREVTWNLVRFGRSLKERHRRAMAKDLCTI